MNSLRPVVHVVGNGMREIAAISGIVNAPSDWQALAQQTDATIHVAENPFRLLGKNEQYPKDWQNQWRQMLVRWLARFETAVAHSAGGADLLAIEQWVDLDNVVLINPPTRETFSVLSGEQTSPDLTLESDPTLRTIDSLLYALRGNMRDDAYRTMRGEHRAHYGDNLRKIIKHESPVKTGVTTELKAALVRATRSRLTLIIGMLDPWEDPVRRKEIVRGKPETQVIGLETGHFSHVERPDLIAQEISALRPSVH